MKKNLPLKPMTEVSAPSYPDHRRGHVQWKSVAAVLGASVALWLPACGLSECGRLSGEPPAVERTAGIAPQVDPNYQPPKPETEVTPPPVLPDPEPR